MNSGERHTAGLCWVLLSRVAVPPDGEHGVLRLFDASRSDLRVASGNYTGYVAERDLPTARALEILDPGEVLDPAIALGAVTGHPRATALFDCGLD